MLVGESSALASGWGRSNIVREPPLNLSHTQLECDPNVLAFLSTNLDKKLPHSTILVTPPALTFSTSEGGFTPSAQSITSKNVGAAGSVLNYAPLSNSVSWIGISGPTIPLAVGASATVTVTAKPAGLLASGSPYTGLITVSDTNASNNPQQVAVTFVINPAMYSLTITTNGTGTGSVSASPPGLSYTNGTHVTLTAIPGSGSTFAGWSGDASGTGTATVIMNAARNVSATFNNTNAIPPSISITSVVSTVTDHTSLWTDYSVVVHGTTIGTPFNYTYQAGYGIFGLVNNTLSRSPENWSFSFTYTEFNGPPSVYTIFAEEYDSANHVVASDSKTVTFTY